MEFYEAIDRAEDYPKTPATIGEALAAKHKIKTARQFNETTRRGTYPISNIHFNRICRTFKIKTK
jgi:hypothetical protein